MNPYNSDDSVQLYELLGKRKIIPETAPEDTMFYGDNNDLDSLSDDVDNLGNKKEEEQTIKYSIQVTKKQMIQTFIRLTTSLVIKKRYLPRKEERRQRFYL